MPSPTPTIPLPYTLLLTIFEPVLALSGALNALLSPHTLLSATLPSLPYTPALRPLMVHLSGSWLLLAYHDFFVLRSERYRNDIALWRHTLLASSLSDLAYISGLVLSMGWRRFLGVKGWDVMTAVTVITTVVPFVGKLCFLAGVGLPKKERRGVVVERKWKRK
ncbi:hypothetical protein F5Y17DRAFT_463167 [Xylariaceae sp. FL0594]|nr:hypothetical protein F5Y17DRAFT_463167 [Xylariaceae sp. FL0594]